MSGSEKNAILGFVQSKQLLHDLGQNVSEESGGNISDSKEVIEV